MRRCTAKNIVRKQKLTRLLEMMLDLERDWTVDEMCQQVGISRGTYYRWTKGELGQLVSEAMPPEKYAEATRVAFLDARKRVNDKLLSIATGDDKDARPRDVIAAIKLYDEMVPLQIAEPVDKSEGEAKKFIAQFRPIQISVLVPGSLPAGLLPAQEEGEIIEGEVKELEG